MEGIGSRTGRPSSRYGSTPVFTGPVRRWQKQWVNVSSSISYNHTNTSNANDVGVIRIRRWTPVPASKSGGDSEEERPKRKIRYAPIVALNGKKKEVEKGDVDVKEISKPNQSPAQETSENNIVKKSFDNALAAKSQFEHTFKQASQKNEEATKDLNNQPLDLDADGDDDDEDRDLGGANKVADWVKAAQRGFAP